MTGNNGAAPSVGFCGGQQRYVTCLLLRKIALLLGVSLTLMQLAAKKLEELDGHSGLPGLDLDQLNEMLGEAESVLKEQSQSLHVLECIRSGICPVR